MSELRQDITTGDWVVFATERGKRPHDFPGGSVHADAVASDPSCPFCPGNEDQTPPDLLRLDAGDPWRIRVVPNRFAALTGEEGILRNPVNDSFPSMPGVGAHEVVIETPRHDRAIADMTDEEMTLLFEVYQRRYLSLRRDPRVQIVVIFKNHGVEAGTSLRHPHSQIIASPVETPLLRRRYEVAREHFRRFQRCLYCELRDRERARASRVVFGTDEFVAIHPFASRWPFETWILPRQHNSSFGNAAPERLKDAALATRRALRLLRDSLGDVPFNYVVHTAPVKDEARPYFLWHVQIVPRLTVAAGFELGSGMYINNTFPEDTAKRLRELSARRT